ncbi:hypothetical protein A3C17_01900 [Candidatus Uhrbacteria bacterium RIFCSPHIGHO2_02_FULL_53_13]|uniref:Transcription regulator TrmB N-terminal domain-containing protein n=3 Tax=Candidatus Uhriibacteriota TaxID=1752732 RepID=A0A1F7U0R5_9BACT|nr:MAG: hypothetical protein A3C17_01900 [Candidatus Uhrbacteria bacterium RIFCSPHIGHO2_02_FULL_53_13]OGL89951.1 MAG: hypothetical protein A3I45_01765 [Candidatus Uhrbacteria bacterium RIFCSPLOWO2_02_FULL_53_10]
MELIEELKTLDLTKSEIAVYLFLLESGLSTPPQVAKSTGIARTNCYNVLDSLISKGLAEEHQEGKRKAYLARDPQALVESLERKKQAMERVLPNLRALHVTQKNKPKIQFYDGWESAKGIYRQATHSKEITAIGSTKRLADLDSAFFSDFEKTLKEKGIVLHDILTPNSREIAEHTTKPTLKGLYDFVYFPSNAEDTLTDILIWDDHVALMALEAPIFGTVITNTYIAQSFRMIASTLLHALRG